MALLSLPILIHSHDQKERLPCDIGYAHQKQSPIRSELLSNVVDGLS